MTTTNWRISASLDTSLYILNLPRNGNNSWNEDRGEGNTLRVVLVKRESAECHVFARKICEINMASYWFRCVFRFFHHIKEIKQNYELPCRRGFRINTYRLPKQAPKLLGVTGACSPSKIFGILTPSSPLSWVSESFRWDIGQFHSPRMKHLSNPFSRFQPGKFFLLKIYLLWKIWPISLKRWKPVWIRACPASRLLAFVKSLFAPWLVSHVLLQKPKRSQKETFASRVITSANTVVKYQQGHGSLLNLRNDWLWNSWPYNGTP